MHRSCRFVILDQDSASFLKANHLPSSSTLPPNGIQHVNDPREATQYVDLNRAANIIRELHATGTYSKLALQSLSL